MRFRRRRWSMEVGNAVKRLIDDDALYLRSWEQLRSASHDEVSETLCAAQVDPRVWLLVRDAQAAWCPCVQTSTGCACRAHRAVDDDCKGDSVCQQPHGHGPRRRSTLRCACLQHTKNTIVNFQNSTIYNHIIPLESCCYVVFPLPSSF